MPTLKPLELIFLWGLATKPESSAWLAEHRPELAYNVRQQLITQGLIESIKEKRQGRTKSYSAQKIYLTDRGWQFLHEHIEDPVNARTYEGAKLFGRFLLSLSRLLKKNGLSLAEVLGDLAVSPAQDPAAQDPAAQPPAPQTPADRTDDLVTVVKKHLETLTQNNYRPEKGLKISDFRKHCPDLPQDQLDAALIELQSQGYLNLNSLADDPSQLTPEDQKAAVLVAHKPRHLIIINSLSPASNRRI
jgi:hypothetical protein